MALVFTNNTYAGSAFADYFTKLVLSGRTFSGPDGPIVNLMPNITGIEVIRKIDQGVVFQGNTKAFSPSGDQDFSETVVQPIRMSVQFDFDRNDIYRTWSAMEVGPGVNKVDMPQNMRAAIFKLASEQTSSLSEQLVWSGKSSNATAFTFSGTLDGWFALAKAGAPAIQKKTVGSRGQLALTAITNAGVVTVSATTNLRTGDYVTIGSTTDGNQLFPATTGATIKGQTFQIAVIDGTTIQLVNPTTGANAAFSGATVATTGAIGFINSYSVQEALVGLIQVLPNRVQYTSDENKPRIYVSPNVMTAYKDSIAQAQSLVAGFLNYRTPEYIDQFTDTFRGFKLEAVPNTVGNQMLASSVRNLVCGTSTLTDLDNMIMIDMRTMDASNAFRFRSDFSLDAKIAFLNEVSYTDAAI
jgi:hypothetical protein